MRKRPVAHTRRIKTVHGYRTILINEGVKRVKKKNKNNLKKIAFSLYYWNKEAKRLRDEYIKLEDALEEGGGIEIKEQLFYLEEENSREYLWELNNMTPDDEEEEEQIKDEIERVEELVSEAYDKLKELRWDKEEIYDVKDEVVFKYGKPTNIYHSFGSEKFAFRLYYIGDYSFHSPTYWEEVPKNAVISKLNSIPSVKLLSKKKLIENDLLYSLEELWDLTKS